MALYIGNKKYCAIKKSNLNNTDILITTNGNYTPNEPYTGFGLVRVQIPDPVLDELTVTPKTTEQDLTSLNDGFSKVHVEAVTSDIDEDILSENIKEGIEILGVTGTFKFTTEELTIDPSIEEQVKTPTADGFSKVTVNPVTADIDEDIKPENIVKDVSILGVLGTAILSNETTRTITSNGTYEPEEPYTGFSSVVVDVKLEHEELNITPTTEKQTFNLDSEYKGYSPVTVEAVTADIDPDILAGNIKEGVDILGVVGTVIEVNNTTTTITSNGTYTPDPPYTGFSSVEVKIEPTKLDITPTTQEQVFDEEFYNPVTVKAVTSTIDPNILAENIKQGVEILGVAGTVIELKAQELTINSNGEYTPDTGYNGFSKVTVDINTVNNTDIIVDPKTTEQVFTPDESYTGFGKVTVNAVTASIDENIIPENIKKGVEILGVIGTSEGGSLQDLTITVNETTDTVTEYTPEETYSGFKQVTLDLTWIEEQLQALNAGDADTTTLKLQEKTVTPTSIEQPMDVTADDGYDGLSKITIDMSVIKQLFEESEEQFVTVQVDDFLDGSGSNFVSDCTFIREFACYYYAGLTDVVLNNAETIGISAFANSGLTNLTIKTSQVCTLSGSNCFESTPIANGLGYIYVPAELVDSYKADSNWIIYADQISAIA